MSITPPDPAVVDRVKQLAKLKDEEIMGLMWGSGRFDRDLAPIEMSRRFMVAANRASVVLIGLTIVIGLLTVVLAVLGYLTYTKLK